MRATRRLRLGLGRAAALECIRRCAALGAREACVDNDFDRAGLPPEGCSDE